MTLEDNFINLLKRAKADHATVRVDRLKALLDQYQRLKNAVEQFEALESDGSITLRGDGDYCTYIRGVFDDALKEES